MEPGEPMLWQRTLEVIVVSYTTTLLRDYREVLARIYAPAAYFGRARRAAS
jgi:hypothetical protein